MFILDPKFALLVKDLRARVSQLEEAVNEAVAEKVSPGAWEVVQLICDQIDGASAAIRDKANEEHAKTYYGRQA